MAGPKDPGLELLTVSYRGSREERLGCERNFSIIGIARFRRELCSHCCRESRADLLLRVSGQRVLGGMTATWVDKGCFVLWSDSDTWGRGAGDEAILFVLNHNSLKKRKRKRKIK